jgi:hypothetical protein
MQVRRHFSGLFATSLGEYTFLTKSPDEMKSITLPSTHYAASWKTEGMIKSLPEINDLGRRYAELPAEMAGISNPAKQDLLLELCQCFHPYLMKYLVMICRGHVPILGIGPKSTFGNVNGDVKKFLYYFLPKGQTLTRQNLNPVVRHLHLAFKDMETEERYDVLMEQMVRAINQYDPKYTEKVKLVVEAINRELSKRTQFAAVDVRRYLEFDCSRHIRLLCRRGFLTSNEKPGLEEEGIFSPRPAEVWWDLAPLLV